MLKRIMCCLLAALMALAIFETIAVAAGGDILWKKNFGGNNNDYYNSVVAVSDGIVAVGTSAVFDSGDWTGVTIDGFFDAIIVKYDNSGNVLWKDHFGGSSPDIYESVAAVSDGVVAVGYSENPSFGNGDWMGVAGNGATDAIIVKYDNNGNVVWKKNFGGGNFDYFNSVTTLSDGIIAVGYSLSFGSGDWTGVTGNGGIDAIIVKYDYNGNVVWKKNFGGIEEDFFKSVTTVSNGVVAVGFSGVSVGTSDQNGFTGNGSLDAIIVKYDNNGNVVWEKSFGGSGDDIFMSVTAVSGGVVAAGNSYLFGDGDWTNHTGRGSSDAIMVKYDNNGNVVWKKNFGGSELDIYHSITAVSGGIVAVGISHFLGDGDWPDVIDHNGGAIIVKYDSNGNVLWKNKLHGIYYSVTAVSNGVVSVGYAIYFGSGDWAGFSGNGTSDAIIVRYDDSIEIEQVIVPSYDPYRPDAYINLTDETCTLPDGYIVAAYSLNGGKTWRRGALPIGAKFNNIFNKKTHIWVSDSYYLSHTVGETGGVRFGEIIKFEEIEARPKANAEKLKPFYMGDTWTLRTKDGAPASAYYEWAATTNKKTPDGAWQPLTDGFPVLSSKIRVTYLFHTPAIKTVGSPNIYTPASKNFKISPVNYAKAPKYKISKNNTLKLKSGDYYQVNNDAPVQVTTTTTLDMSQYSGATITVWKGETGKKPRSEKQIINVT